MTALLKPLTYIEFLELSLWTPETTYSHKGSLKPPILCGPSLVSLVETSWGPSSYSVHMSLPIYKYLSALVFVTFLKYHEALEGRDYDVFTSRFLVASTGNFFEMNWSGAIVVGHKDGASVPWVLERQGRHGAVSLEDQLPLWRKCLCFSHQLKGIQGYCLSGAKSRLDWHHPQSYHKFVGEKEKASGFSKCYLHAFQENKQNTFRSNFLSVCGHHPHNQNRKLPKP